MHDRGLERGILHGGGLRRAWRQEKIGEEASLARSGIARGVNLNRAVSPGFSGPIGVLHAGVPQRDFTFEHEIDGLAAMCVPGGPSAGRKIHHELYKLRLLDSIRDIESGLRDDRAFAAGSRTAPDESEPQARSHERQDRKARPRPELASRHGSLAHRAVTIVVQALSSLGSSRLLAICTLSLRPPPRTTGQ